MGGYKMEFKNKTVVITGGTSGIGKVAALEFGRLGATVVIGGRREKEGEEVAEQIVQAGGIARFISLDVSKEADVKNFIDQTVKQFGKLDIAFNNAGVESVAPVTEVTAEEYRKVMDINVLGILLSLKYEIPAMLKSGGGSIINTSSVAGHKGMANVSLYCASKHAVEAITKSVALEYATQNIRINSVAPAAIQTEMLDRFIGSEETENRKGLREAHPVGRFGKSDEVAAAVIFLASNAASFTTGASIPVDGGYLLK
jgi:NAD(P)-dependent dehydrogenase (short-subunit alcohol dehydrogenase family)